MRDGQDLVHGSAHGLHDLLRHALETNHVGIERGQSWVGDVRVTFMAQGPLVGMRGGVLVKNVRGDMDRSNSRSRCGVGVLRCLFGKTGPWMSWAVTI